MTVLSNHTSKGCHRERKNGATKWTPRPLLTMHPKYRPFVWWNLFSYQQEFLSFKTGWRKIGNNLGGGTDGYLYQKMQHYVRGWQKSHWFNCESWKTVNSAVVFDKIVKILKKALGLPLCSARGFQQSFHQRGKAGNVKEEERRRTHLISLQQIPEYKRNL